MSEVTLARALEAGLALSDDERAAYAERAAELLRLHSREELRRRLIEQALPRLWNAPALVETRAPVVAISPIVGTAPASGPAGKMMRAKGLEVSVLGVLAAYAEILDVLVIDERDRPKAEAIRSRGVRPAFVDIMMVDRAREASLARATLEAVG